MEKLKLQQKQKVDTVFWSDQETQKQPFSFSSLVAELVQSILSVSVMQACALPLAGYSFGEQGL